MAKSSEMRHEMGMIIEKRMTKRTRSTEACRSCCMSSDCVSRSSLSPYSSLVRLRVRVRVGGRVRVRVRARLGLGLGLGLG